MTTLAHAQVAGFPIRALKIVVPISPGSGADITARFFGEPLDAALGQPVLVVQNVGNALRLYQRGGILDHGRILKMASGEKLLGDPDIQRSYMGL